MNLIVDGNNIAVRCWKSMPVLTTTSGKHVSTIFGVIKTLRSSIESFNPDSVLMTWDDTPRARRALFPEYKEKRKEAREEFTPDEQEDYRQFNRQCDELREVLSLFGLHQYYGKDVEADDLISELSKKDKTIILSEDKDFIQLISDKVKLYRPITQALYTLKNFEELTKLPNPAMYLQARLIMGDKSDEIPGVPGFKEGRTIPLIMEHKTAWEALNAAKSMPGKLMQTLASSEEILARNTLLMDLKYSSEYLPKSLDSYRHEGDFNEKRIKAAVLKLEFYSYMNNLVKFVAPFKDLK